MTEQNKLPKTLGPFTLHEPIETGWGWSLFRAEQALEGGKTRTIRLRVFFNQPKNGQLHTRLLEARDIFKKHTHLHLQRIFEVQHFTLEARNAILAVAEERYEDWTPPRETDYRSLMGQLLGAVEHMASVKLPGAGLSKKNLGRTSKGNAVICNLSAVWEQHWSGRSRAGDGSYYRNLPPEMAEQPAEFSGPQWVWSTGVILLDALASMKNSDATISDELDVFDSAVSEYLSHNHGDYFEKQIEGLPDDIREILRKCLAGKAEDRYPNLQVLREAIEYPIKTSKSGERYIMPSSYRVGEVTTPSRKKAMQAYSLGFLIFSAAFAIVLLFVLFRDPQKDIIPLKGVPDIDQISDPELDALREKLEDRVEPVTVQEESDQDANPEIETDPMEFVDEESPRVEPPPEIGALVVIEKPAENPLPAVLPEPDLDTLFEPDPAPEAVPEPDPVPLILEVVNQTENEIILLNEGAGISNSLAAQARVNIEFPEDFTRGEIKALGLQPWIFSTFEVDAEQTNTFQWVVDSLTVYKAEVVLRNVDLFPDLNITYSKQGEEAENPFPQDQLLVPGTYQFRLHRPDYLTIRMVVKFPSAPGRFAFSIPTEDRWVKSSHLKQLSDWIQRAATEPAKVLEEINRHGDLTFESPENTEKLKALKQSIENPTPLSSVTLRLIKNPKIKSNVTFLISSDEESTKTLTPDQSIELTPGTYVAQFMRPDYAPLQTNVVVSGDVSVLPIEIPGESSWTPSQQLLDLLALEKAYLEKKNSRTIIFLMQGLKNVEFENPEHQQRYTTLRRQYYDRAMD